MFGFPLLHDTHHGGWVVTFQVIDGINLVDISNMMSDVCITIVEGEYTNVVSVYRWVSFLSKGPLLLSLTFFRAAVSI